VTSNDKHFWCHIGDAPSYCMFKTTRNMFPITPGTLLYLLVGNFRGKRVICLKVLNDGLLIVTDPYKINGVPPLRVRLDCVLATSISIDISGANVRQFLDEYYSMSKEDSAPSGYENSSSFFTASNDTRVTRVGDNSHKTRKVSKIIIPVLKTYRNGRYLKKSLMKCKK